MKKTTFTLTMTIGIWEAEMLIKALDGYEPKKGREEYSKQDLTRLILRQTEKAKEELK